LPIFILSVHRSQFVLGVVRAWANYLLARSGPVPVESRLNGLRQIFGGSWFWVKRLLHNQVYGKHGNLKVKNLFSRFFKVKHGTRLGLVMAEAIRLLTHRRFREAGIQFA